MTRAWILAGGNVGDMESRLARAEELLAGRAGRVAAASRLYRSEPWGFEAAGLFANRAFAVDTELAPEALLDTLQEIERLLGRDRRAEEAERARTGARYVSRPIDLDLLFYGSARIDSARLQVPHPLLPQRAFALRPLCEIAPALRHPVSGRSVAEMLGALEREDETQKP